MLSDEDGTLQTDYYSSKSYWLETCGDDLIPRPAFNKSQTVDIAILGAGFTGLWTAYYLLRNNPSLNIAVLEKEIVGFGASGRNGGWCSPKFPISPHVALKRYGKNVAKNLQMAMFESVREIGRVIQEEKIDADWKLGGSLQVALGDYGLPLLERNLSSYKELGLENQFQLLSQEQLEERVRINGAVGALLTKCSAVLNPGKLVRQLAKVLEYRGVKIYEKTEVLDYEKGGERRFPKLITRQGTLTAKHAVVLSGEAYLSRLPKFRRRIIPIYSFITLTEPLTDSQWSSIGWKGRETIGSTRLSVEYLQRTVDGRILFGGRGLPYQFASGIKDSFDKHKPTHDMLKQMVNKWFPATSGIKFTHSWGGPVGITRDWTPNIIYDKNARVACAWGFAGQGVSTANLAGRILCDLINERKSTLTALPMVQHISKKWEPEPIRWLGVRFVQFGLERVDKKSESSGNPPTGDTLAERLSLH